MGFSIQPLAADQQSQWDDYVRQHPEGTFFHLLGWRDILHQVFKHPCHYLCAVDSGSLVGVLPLAQVKTLLFGNSLVSTPFCVYGGALADSEEILLGLEDEAARLAERLRVDCLELRNLHRRRADWPTKELYVTYRKEILPELDDNLKAIPRKQRAMVRKGIKNGLTAVVDEDIERFFAIYSESVRNHGTPMFPKQFFQALKQTFGDACELQVTSHDGEVVSAVMSFYYADEVLPYYGGGTPAARRLAAFDFMYWEVMRRACESGLKVFDYGRSKQGTGSFSFKKNWGFEAQPLYYQYHLVKLDTIPEVNPLNPKYRLFIKAWQLLPVWLANRLGPLLSRGLG